ncbi:MAG: hypothetical protein OEZ52_03835 [Candidatus Aminicenantes bacterium]|nr:hypothetical protein [Candidatus Aminicenantes bacterium]MDH5742652.1 hypothetical protein [Candidatus Aminicenantes bacterium]
MIEDKLRKNNAVKKEFHHQWKEVLKNNPLIAAAYLMQKIEFVSEVLQKLSPLSFDAAFKFESTEELTSAFLDTDSMRTIAIRFTNCLDKLDRDLERAQSDEETKAAFDGFGRCWRGEKDS